MSQHTDHQVGGIVDDLEESGQLDNTLIFNGASGEGSPNGSVNEGRFFTPGRRRSGYSSYKVLAEVEIADSGAQGAILA